MMPNKSRLVLLERGIAKNMIRMHMGVNHEAYWQARAHPNRFAQRKSDTVAATGINDGHRIAPDYKTNVGNIAVIMIAKFFMHALVHVHARRNLRHLQGRSPAQSNRQQRAKYQ